MPATDSLTTAIAIIPAAPAPRLRSTLPSAWTAWRSSSGVRSFTPGVFAYFILPRPTHDGRTNNRHSRSFLQTSDSRWEHSGSVKGRSTATRKTTRGEFRRGGGGPGRQRCQGAAGYSEITPHPVSTGATPAGGCAKERRRLVRRCRRVGGAAARFALRRGNLRSADVFSYRKSEAGVVASARRSEEAL